MININNKNCIHINCIRKAYFNILGSLPKYCSLHKLDNMINVLLKKCKIDNCIKIAHYNIYGKSPLYCSDHKLDKMINVSSKKCIFNNCIKIPSFNYINFKSPLYCNDHKLKNMICVVNKICLSNNCNKKVTLKYDGYCPSCYIKLYLYKLLKTNTKEYNVIYYILSKFNKYDWKINEKIQSGSSNRRPDLHLILDNYSIIIEINEYQHKRYKSLKNNNDRILELSKDLNYKPLIIINFNPDNYIYNNKNIKSCWKYIDHFWILKDSKKQEWDIRLNILLSEIQKCLQLDSVLQQNINIINLFYDNYQCDLLINNLHKSNLNTNDNFKIYYFSELSSDSDDNNQNIHKLDYLSNLSSDSDDHNINIYSKTPLVF